MSLWSIFFLAVKVVGMLVSSLQLWGRLAAGAGQQWGLSPLDCSSEDVFLTQQSPWQLSDCQSS